MHAGFMLTRLLAHVHGRPGVTGAGTPEGDRKSKLYNDVVQRGAMRFAMLESLRKPVKGFEDACRNHFRPVTATHFVHHTASHVH